MAGRNERLEELVSRSDFEALFEVVTVDDVAAVWCSYHSREHDYTSEEPVDDPDWWAVDLFTAGAISELREIHRSLLLQIALTASDKVLGSFAAGPLECFVSDDPDDLAWLEEQCRAHERMRIALRGVWCTNQVSEETLLRLDRMAGAKFWRPLPREEWPQWLIEQSDAEERLTALAGPRWYDLAIEEDVSEEVRTAIAEYLRTLEEGHPDRDFLIQECHLDPE